MSFDIAPARFSGGLPFHHVACGDDRFADLMGGKMPFGSLLPGDALCFSRHTLLCEL